MITIATSRDNALVRAVEYLLCGGLELDQQAQRIPSFIYYHLSHLIPFFPSTLFVVLCRNEQLPSLYNTNTNAHSGTYGVSIFAPYCKIHDKKSLYN